MNVESKLRRMLDEGAGRAQPSPRDFEDVVRGAKRRRRNRAGAVGAAGAAAAVVLALVLSPLGTSPVTEIVPAVEGGAWTWERTTLSGENGGMGDLAGKGEVMVAVGNPTSIGTDRGSFWRSADGGETWASVEADVGEGITPAEPRAVVAFEDGFVAAGFGPGQRGGWVWTSQDGSSWERAEIEGAGLLYDVATDGRRVVVTGRGPGFDASGAWWSDDARTWQASTIEAGSGGNEDLLSTTGWGPQGFVSFGYGPDDTLANLWTSADGTHWEHVSETVSGLGGEEGVIDAVASDGSGYLALRAGGGVYRSADGRSWERIVRLGGDNMVRFSALVRTGEGWIAAGNLGPSRAVVWESSDGERWHVILETAETDDADLERPGAPGVLLAEYYVGGVDYEAGRLVVVGQVSSSGQAGQELPEPGQEHPAVWKGTPSG